MKKLVFVTLAATILSVSSYAQDVIFSIYDNNELVKTQNGCKATIWTDEGSVELIVSFDEKSCKTIKKEETYITNIDLKKCKKLKSTDYDKYACSVNKIKKYTY